MATIMTKRGNQDNVLTYEHICDTTADMESIDPQYITLGSMCLVTQGESGGTEAYIANSNKEWIEIVGGSGNNGSGGSGDGEGGSSEEGNSRSNTIKPNARLVLIDYDGAIVDSYTQSEVDALSALPDNPDHSGDEIPLTSQGWNWTLEEIKEQLAAMPEQAVYVGNVVIPTDGKTHIVIEIPEDTPENRRDVTVRWNQTASEGVTVDWGDGSATEAYSETGANGHNHTYASGGMYDITLDVTSGTISFGGGRDQGITGPASRAYQYKIARFRKVFIGSGTTATSFGSSIFSMCGMLEIATVPNGIGTIGNDAFYACYSLKSITIPRTVTTINSAAFSTCDHMTSISVPAGLTSLESYVFQNCESIEEVTIPKAVTSFGSYVFLTCKSLKKIILPPGTSIIASQMFGDDRGGSPARRRLDGTLTPGRIRCRRRRSSIHRI